ncbi:MAG: alpha-glucan family phosphorylase [Actinomycetota bacterium]
MRALRRFTVRTQLPDELARLMDLVMNLRWSWHPPSIELFEQVDPKLWHAVGRDPLRLLGEVTNARLDELAADSDFNWRLGEVHADLQRYLTEPKWYQSLPDAPTSIAYFSPEYGISAVLPQYSGGLGILAGDHLKTASDLGVPIVGVGLLYRRGYFRQSLSRDGWQLEHYPPIDPHGLPVTLLTDEAGVPKLIHVDLPHGGKLWAHVWVAQVGRVPLLLLDSDVEDNAPSEREVTDRLYGGGSEHRLLQELLLGIGGVRAVYAYGAQPEVFHTNEGHAGFLGLERIRILTEEQGLDYDTALQAVRAGTVFTTHTPVPAGIDRFPAELIEQYFGGDNAAKGVPIERILELGDEPGGDGSVFNMAFMGLRLGQRANGVSELHGHVSRDMFAGLWPGFDTAEVPIRFVTNGVHAPTWVHHSVQALAPGDIGARLTQLEQTETWAALGEVPDEALWSARSSMRADLVEEVRRRLRSSWLIRGASPAELGWIDSALDQDALTIGFARRVPSYKRLTLMLRDEERLTKLLLDVERPLQFIVAGKAHPADDGGKELVQQIVQFADKPEVRHRIVFLPDYDMEMARYLVSGCDVWLNNPLRPLEACGTSGMKSSLNGGLNLSIRDGWWDELFDGENGWAIPSAVGVEDADRRDDLEANAIYDLLETSVVPRFYHRTDGVPRRWTEMVRHTLTTTAPKLVSTRMVREYVTSLYIPATVTSRALAASKYAGARSLATWRGRVMKAWPSVGVRHVEGTGGELPVMGEQIAVRAIVDLGTLTPDDVEVQAAYGRVDEGDLITGAAHVVLTVAGEHGDGEWAYNGEIPLNLTGPFGYTVRVLPKNSSLVASSELGLVASA